VATGSGVRLVRHEVRALPYCLTQATPRPEQVMALGWLRTHHPAWPLRAPCASGMRRNPRWRLSYLPSLRYR
jgi:hypothetical protein